MNYNEAVEWLYSQTPQFQQIGAAAYKPGLDTVRILAGAFGNPQDSYKIIHVAGTNGKGSTCHTLAAILHAAGRLVFTHRRIWSISASVYALMGK